MSESSLQDSLQSGWAALVAGLKQAEQTLLQSAETEDGTTSLTASELADAYQALVRACMNQLGRFEVERANPELAPYNGWREKFFMDNPDFRYWVADIDANHEYVIKGNIGDATFWSVTAYTANGLADAQAASRLDLDGLITDAKGNYEIKVSNSVTEPGANQLELPEGANSIWVRGFYDNVYSDEPGNVQIEPATLPNLPPVIEPQRVAHRLQRLGKAMAGAAKGMVVSARADLERPNQVRVWEEMQAGAVFTEPEIYYQRGAWQLTPEQALVIDVSVPDCRYWNLMLYSRYLNSLDHRNRPISLTGGRAKTLSSGDVRIVLSGEPQTLSQEGINSLDTEGRPFGIFVFRWLKPVSDPELPRLRVVSIDSLRQSEQGES